MAKQMWLVTTQSKSKRLADGIFDISTFTDITEDPVD